ncbi:sensor histidine kinase [Actinoplanes teichomyceticus]|uniref:histidine kinase n=1 Tax=Actinoplanes teichomyceticus TaxID=1867 RepID=A0A561WJR8_ACTTI|nr:sensor histidine kinase [Actinoplanes teichomyceticus]TWG24073.1 signal transduction histidine kinase [Actinoplanes teichomyceticus]GIF12113.1 hypothetical protein Ate01nite_21450 [Actinoplanes teichomyceticus]
MSKRGGDRRRPGGGRSGRCPLPGAPTAPEGGADGPGDAFTPEGGRDRFGASAASAAGGGGPGAAVGGGAPLGEWLGDPGRPGPPWHHRRRHPHTGWPPGAVVLAGALHLATLNNLAAHGGLYRPWDLLTTLTVIIGPVALFWRRRAPIAAFAVASAATIGFALHAVPHPGYAAAPAVALYSLARQGHRTAALSCAATAWAVWAGAVLGLSGPLGLDPGVRPAFGQVCLAAALLGLMILLGGAARIRAENYAEQARTRAEQERARAEQARARAEQERRQASEERLRIARELHDVLGHHLSLINVQAGVGLHLMDQRPEQAREALAAIKTASAEALREVRSVLGVLRTEGEAAPRQPALGLNRLSELTAAAGIPVRTTVTGTPRELPAEVDRAAYRIVQEALTNVRRHAGPRPEADVAVSYLPAALYLSVRNSEPEAAQPPAADGARGSGIAGMRARAESLGGRLAAGRPPTGGFLVTVILPTGRSPAGPAGPGSSGVSSAGPGSSGVSSAGPGSSGVPPGGPGSFGVPQAGPDSPASAGVPRDPSGEDGAAGPDPGGADVGSRAPDGGGPDGGGVPEAAECPGPVAGGGAECGAGERDDVGRRTAPEGER